MRGVFVCPDVTLARFVPREALGERVLHLVESAAAQRRISRHGGQALAGDLEDEALYRRALLTGHDAVGDLMFYGRGAGQLPTASAVWSDAVEIARRIAHGIPVTGLELPSAGASALPLQPMDMMRTCYYLRVMAQDRPGVLSRITGVLGDHDISIASVIQKGRATAEAVPVVMMTHEARERDMRAALTAIDGLADVALATTMIRVEDSEGASPPSDGRERA